MLREDKKESMSRIQVMNQSRYGLLSSVRFNYLFGLHETVVYSAATIGSKGEILCAWGEVSPESVSQY